MKNLLSKLFGRTSKRHYTINECPLIVFGNQKSGTSAIAHLLADYSGLSKTIDIPEINWPVIGDLMEGRLPMETFERQNAKRFAADLIKEPALTFLAMDLVALHPHGQFVFVVRDPRANIRSILNRIEVAGTQADLGKQEASMPTTWRYIFDAGLWGLDADAHFLDVLATRWNLAADIYLENPDRFVLVQYEAFNKDKGPFISALADQLGLKSVADISDKLDIQYQPRGDHNISWDEFFGGENLARIEKICGSRMKAFGYE